jgi:HK97 family phage portal protein
VKTLTKLRSWIARAAELPVPRLGGTAAALMTFENEIDLKPIKNKQQALEQYSGWVYAAASTISWDIRSNPMRQMRMLGDTEEDWLQLKPAQINPVTTQPNMLMTWGDLLEVTILHLDLTGEAFWHLIKAEGSDRIDGIQIIYPHWVNEPAFNEDNTRLTGWKVTVPGRARVTLPWSDVIFFRYPHPIEPLVGASPVEAFALSHDMDTYARAYGSGLLKNHAMPAGVISTEQELTPPESEVLRSRWVDRHQQKIDIAVFGKGGKFQAIGLPLKDLDFASLAGLSRDQIFAIYKVPASKLGISKDVNRTDSEAHERSYQKNALEPRIARVQEPINLRLMPNLYPSGDVIMIFDSPVDVDKEYQLKKRTTLFEKGALTVNQLLTSLGEPAQDDGDVFMVPTNVERIPAGALATPDPARDASTEKRGSHFWESDLDELLELRFLRAQGADERTMKAKVRQRFSAEQKAVIQAYNESLELRGISDAVHGAVRDWVEDPINGQAAAWNTVFKENLVTGLQRGAVLVGQEVGERVSFEAYRKSAIELADRYAGELVTEVSGTSKEAVRTVIRKVESVAIAEGWGANKTTKAIRDGIRELYDGFKGARAESIARTETARAINEGKQLNATETSRRLKIQMSKRWLATLDKRVREHHGDANNQIRNADEPFEVGGELLMQPGDMNASGRNTIRCRCTSIYRVIEKRL